MTRFFTVFVALLGFSAGAVAYTNVLDSGASQTVTNGWSIPGETVVVGDSTPTNRLTVTSGGAVTSAGLVIGNTAGADGNVAVVNGSGASWVMSGNAVVGNVGSANSMIITNGGSVENVEGLIGGGAGSSGNKVVVAGADSQWRNQDSLYLGTYGAATNLMAAGTGNSLVVSNGGWTYVGEASTNDVAAGAGGGILVASTNGAVLIADNGSSVETTGTLYVGGIPNNLTGSVTVTNGSTVKVSGLQIGSGGALNLDSGGTLFATGDYNADTQTNVNWSHGGTLAVGGTLTKSNGLAEADGERLILTMDGGDWDLGGDLLLAGTSNRLNIVNGGAVTNDAAYVVGTGNVAVVEDSGSLWLNQGTLNVTNSGNGIWVLNGGTIQADALNIADGNSLNLNSGGTLELTGSYDVESHSNVNWTSGGRLSVAGDLTGMSSVELAVGGSTNQYTYLGAGRALTLNGSGAQWTNGTDHLIIGYNTANSDLLITNATVQNADGYVGWGGSSSLNKVKVTGANGVWRNDGGNLFVGAYSNTTGLANTGGENFLSVENGGQVFVGDQTNMLPNTSMLVASASGASLVVGNGSVTLEDALQLGSGTALGTNSIRSGGTVTVGDLKIDSGSLLDLQRGGTFAIQTNFDAQTTGFQWGEGSTLSVGGNLTNMRTTNSYAVLDGSRNLILEGGSWNIPGNDVIVGLDAENSTLTLRNGATMTNGNTFIGWSTNAGQAAVALNQGSSWENTGNLWVGYGGSANNLLIAGGSTNSVGGHVFIGNTNTIGNLAEVTGSNSYWDITGNLDIGSRGGGTSNNLLSVTGQGVVKVGGTTTVYAGNNIAMGDAGLIELGQTLNVQSNTVIGSLEGTDGTGTLRFADADASLNFAGGNIALGNGLVFESNPTFNNTVSMQGGIFSVVESNSLQYVGFDTLNLNDSTVFGYGSLDAFNAVNMTNGTIAPSASLSDDQAGILTIHGDFSSSNTTYFAQSLAKGYDQLLFEGASQAIDLTGLVANVWMPNAPSNNVATILQSSSGITNGFKSVTITDGLLLFDAVLTNQGDRVDLVVSRNNTKFSSALTYAGTEGIRAGFNGMMGTVFARTKQLRRNLVATEHAIPNEAFLLSSTNAPTGVNGPGDQNTIQEMHIWMQYFNGQGSYAPSGKSAGFDLNNSGMTIGVDRLFGEALTAGLNYTYTRSDAQTSQLDSLQSETYWLGAYGEWVGLNGLYVDTLAAVGRSSYDSRRVEGTYTGTAGYNGRTYGAYADVGQYYHYKNLALSPYLGLHVLRVSTDDYAEDNAFNELTYVDQFTRNWVESALGLKARHRFDTRYGRFQTSGYAEWSHDFLQDDIYTTMDARDGLGPVEMARISPDPDVVNTGLGFSWINTDYLEIGVGYNGRFSENYEEHTGSLMLDIRF